MKVLVTIVLAILVGYGLWLTALFFMQRSMIYPGIAMQLPERAPPENVESIWFETDEARIEAWWMPVANPRAIVIHTHGNGELIDYTPDEAGRLRHLNIAVLAVEYPGYARSSGVPDQQTITQTLVAAYDWISHSAGYRDLPILGYGRSLGGGAIAQLATRRHLDGLLLESTFTSIRALAARYYAPTFLIRDQYDTEAVLKDFNGPVLIVHGTADAVIAYSHSEKLLTAAKQAQRLSFECGHNDCPPSWPHYLQKIDAFFTETGVLKQSIVVEDNPLSNAAE